MFPPLRLNLTEFPFAPRRSTVDVCLGGQRSPVGERWGSGPSALQIGKHPQLPASHLAGFIFERPRIFSTCLALRRAQQIEREVSESEDETAVCALGSIFTSAPGIDSIASERAKNKSIVRGCTECVEDTKAPLSLQVKLVLLG